MSDLVVIQRLLLAMVLVGFIGYERERHGRAAGFRTHMLVGIGACLMMLTGLYLMDSLRGRTEVDPTRLAAQVVSGIGFLGAGTILQFRGSIRGLTTAASLWAAAGIGLATGAGFLFGAVSATAVVFVALFGLARWERQIRKAWHKVLIVETQAGNEGLPRIRQILSNYEVQVQDFTLKQGEESGTMVVELDVNLVSDRHEEAIVREVSKLDGTRRAHWA